MKKRIKNKKLKELICENLEGIKTYEICWKEELEFSTEIKARSEEEARELWDAGDGNTREISRDLIDDSIAIVGEH